MEKLFWEHIFSINSTGIWKRSTECMCLRRRDNGKKRPRVSERDGERQQESGREWRGDTKANVSERDLLPLFTLETLKLKDIMSVLFDRKHKDRNDGAFKRWLVSLVKTLKSDCHHTASQIDSFNVRIGMKSPKCAADGKNINLENDGYVLVVSLWTATFKKYYCYYDYFIAPYKQQLLAAIHSFILYYTISLKSKRQHSYQNI